MIVMKSNQILTISVATALIIISLSLAYYFVIFLPKKYNQDASTKLYNQLIEQNVESNKAQTLKECTSEVEKNIEKNGSSIKVRSNQEAIDLYKQLIDICMVKKGYSN